LLFALDSGHAHLNHGSLGAAPLPVLRAQQRLRDEMEGNPQRFYTRGLTDRLAHARRFLAGFLGADPEGSALISNTTFGVAVALHSVGLGPGDEVLTTDHGYGAVDLAVDATGARRRVVPLPLTASADEIVSAVRGAIAPGRTRLVIIDLITSASARLFPVARVAEALRGTGVPLLVDGAHGPGALDLNVTALGADFFVGNLHKWAFAPRSTALLTVAQPWRARIRPVVVSWHQHDGFPLNVEIPGTIDHTSWLAAPIGVYLLRTLGADRVRAHNEALVRYGQHLAAAALGLPASQLPDPGGPVPMRVIPLPVGGGQAAAVRLRDRIAEELRVEVAVTVWRDRLLLRLCAQVYNQPHEYERLAEGLPSLLR
jgi:isopenicillin-N epimerase